jgi:glyceraldehyde-3-phosphate dehydrogenase (NADP+)
MDNKMYSIKIIYVHESIADEFNTRFAPKWMLLPLEILGKRGNVNSFARKRKPAYIQELIDDAIKMAQQSQ